MSADGKFFTSPDLTRWTGKGANAPAYVTIPVSDAGTVEEEEEWAEALLEELAEKVAA